MRLKLFMLLSLFLSLNVMAQTGLRGVVIDSRTNVPVAGATVLLDEQGVSAITGPAMTCCSSSAMATVTWRKMS